MIAPYWLSATTVTRLPLMIFGYMKRSSGLIMNTHSKTDVTHFSLRDQTPTSGVPLLLYHNNIAVNATACPSAPKQNTLAAPEWILDCRFSLRFSLGSANTSIISGCNGIILVTARPIAPILPAKYANRANQDLRCSQNRHLMMNPVIRSNVEHVHNPQAKT